MASAAAALKIILPFTFAFTNISFSRTCCGGGFTPRLRVKSRSLSHEIEIAIRDNGNGVPAAIRASLFTPFFTTKPTGQGIGLGLSLSHDIVVQGHSGQLFFESNEGEFTEFFIRLPR